MSVRIYVEGGGRGKEEDRARCRQGFREFFARILPPGHLPRVIARGSREDTFDAFRTALRTQGVARILLLIDSEGPVPMGMVPWAHLKASDGWEQPLGTTDDQVHLMVQCTEAWFLADPEALSRYYQQGFHEGALPCQPEIEQISKVDILSRLDRATRRTRKGRYHKTSHAFDLLARIDPDKVCAVSPHARRLREVLLRES